MTASSFAAVAAPRYHRSTQNLAENVRPRDGALCHLIRARWYDAGTGTWLTPDPVGYKDSSNLYAYCAGDPVNCADPHGLESFTPDERHEMQARHRIEARAQADQCRREGKMSEACLSDFGRIALYDLGDTDSRVVEGIGRGRYGRGVPTIFINGVWNNFDAAKAHAENVSRGLRQEVDLVYNANQGWFADLAQTFFVNKQNIADQTTKLLVAQIRKDIRQLKPGEHVQLIAHSQGAAIVSSAASFLTKEERARIDLTTFGGAAWFYPHGFNSRRNAVNLNDFYVGDWVGNGLPLMGMWDTDVDYTLFFSDAFHGFEGYWSVDRSWRDPVQIKQRERDAERRRQERIERNWSKR